MSCLSVLTTLSVLPVLLLDLLVKVYPNGEYSNLAFSTIPGLYPKSSSVKYSCLSNSLDDNADILGASLSKSLSFSIEVNLL